MSLSRLLIANRGEIACRIVRTCRAMGIRTVAVYTDADADALHVRQADEALRIASYLDIAAIVDAARAAGAEAVHPGYGFLSERTDFAQACVDAGLVYVGPSPESIAAMGDKARAKRRMLEAGVPCVPGYLGLQQDEATLLAEARLLGFPLLVKAVAGGGGRGMRRVSGEAELAAAIEGARREAEGAFGDGALMLERLIARGRHIEIQVFADAHGNAVHLGERDCTTQRRRQKVIEEAPSPVITAAQREAMARDALAAARAVRYVGAGTVEFIVDEATGEHFFLEMNTRLQVEHPVTEAVTGLDLVEWQLRVAAGEPLPLHQEQIRFEGHAIEVRLYAEDPYQGFRPHTGRIARWRPPAGVRVDAGIFEGDAVGPDYDPMLAKLIAHGRDREDAIRRLACALDEAPLLGLVHNGGFLRELLGDQDFREARLHTASLDERPMASPRPSEADGWLAAALLVLGEGRSAGPRPAGVSSYGFRLRCGGETRRWTVSARGRCVRVDGHEIEFLPGQSGRARIDGIERRYAAVILAPGRVQLASGAQPFEFEEPSPYPAAASANDPLRSRAPVAGRVAQLKVKPGDSVVEGQVLLSVEAMKMEMWLAAGAAGRVKAVHAASGDAVAAGALLVELETAA